MPKDHISRLQCANEIASDDECILQEPYEHVNLSMSIPSDTLAEFIAWDLEREHGDLGLHSPVNKGIGIQIHVNQGSIWLQISIGESITEA